MATKSKNLKSNTTSKKKASEKAIKSKAVKLKMQNEPNFCQNAIIDGLVKIARKDYFVSKTMVTNIHWYSVMGGEEPSAEIKDYPKTAHMSDWYRFVETLNDSQLAKDANVTFFIPFFEEWKYAYRGGTKKTLPESILDYGWFKCNSGGELHPVAQKKPNAFGLYDMGGNLGELCTDAMWHGGDCWLDNYRYCDGESVESLCSCGNDDGGMRLFAKEGAGKEWRYFSHEELWIKILCKVPEAFKKCSCWNLFSADAWCNLLKEQPQFADKCNKWREFSCNSLYRLLEKHPQFVDKCECLSASAWAELLRKSPQFAEKCDK